VASDRAGSRDPEYPNLPAEVIGAYRDPAPGMVVEVVDGLVYTMTRPRPIHQRVGSELHGELRDPFDRGRGGPGGWVLLPEPELSLGDRPDLAAPDVAGWRRERLPSPPSPWCLTGCARSSPTRRGATTSR